MARTAVVRACVVGVLLAPATLLAAAGDLDTTFDSDGKVTTAIGTSSEYVLSVAIQPADAKIVAAGYAWTGSNDDFALARYNANGSLDTSFDTDGKVTTAIGTSSDYARSVVIQPSDGKIVVAGYSSSGGFYDFALARYNTNGSLDTSFDTDGIVTTGFGTGHDVALAVAIQPSDGKIVVAGYAWNGSNYDFALARYNTNGALDTTFDTDGKVTTPFGTSHEYGSSVAIQSSDGRIVVAGYLYNGSNYDFALARYNTNGALDTTFDTDGKVTTAFAVTDDYASGVAIQPADGKIVVVGYSGSGSAYDFALARYSSSGVLDTSFDSDGKVTTAIGAGTDLAYGLAIQPGDGKIVVAGTAYISTNEFALARYNTNGSLDTSFSGDGKVTTVIAAGSSYAYSIALQPADGKIVAAGTAYVGSAYDFALARYLPNTCGDAALEPGEQCDDGNTGNGDCCSSTCQYEPNDNPCPNDSLPCTTDTCNATGTCTHPAGNTGTECRVAAGACDVAEQCDGLSTSCPPDAKSTALCRAAAGVCDLAEACDGVNNNCPPDAFKPATTVCRAAQGACDVTETCDGLTAPCPADAKGTGVCRPAAGVCDVAESCDGAGDNCPPDGKSTALCRAAAGVCDVPESCDGVGDDCPGDGKSTAVCRAAAGVCDLAESCDDLGDACPADAKSTALCRAAAGVCDMAETCDGVNDPCPADAKQPTTTVCRADAGQCDVADTCDGANNACPADAFETNGFPCDDGDLCTGGETCDGSGSCASGSPVLCTDHFKCYKAKDLKQPKFQATTVTLTDQFFGPEATALKKPFLLCNPVDKNGEGITNPAAHLTCYKAKGPKFVTRPQVKAANQFGSVDLELKKTFLTCVPSAKTVLP